MKLRTRRPFASAVSFDFTNFFRYPLNCSSRRSVSVSRIFPARARLLKSLLLALFAGAALHADPIISEFLAANATGLTDEDGAFSDWIEVHNPDATVLDLNGWYLTDSASNKTRWQFPAVTLQPGSYLIVFASGKN